MQLSPRLRRITLQVDDPEALAVQRAGDSAVGVYFPIVTPEGERIPPPIMTGPDGTRYVDPASGAEGRNYSVRHHDGATGSTSTSSCMPADPERHGPRPPVPATGSDSTTPGRGTGPSRPPTGSCWSPTCPGCPPPPASSRSFPAASPPPPSSRSPTATTSTICRAHPDVTVIPSIGTGNGHAPSRLAQLVRELTLPDGRGYCWFAGRGRRIPRRAQALPRPRLDDRPARHHRLLAVRLRDLGRQSSPSSKTRSSRSTSAPWPTARATRWPPRSSTKRSNGPASRPP